VAIDLDENVAELLADKFLNKLAATEWAIKALERGFDSKNLRILASMQPIDSAYEIRERQRLALAELGWNIYAPYVYMIQWARRIAKDILSGKTDPMKGSAELYLILRSIDALFELSAWYSIDECLSSQAYFRKTGNKDYFYLPDNELKSEIKGACEDFLRKTDSNLTDLSGTTFEQAEALYRNFLGDNKISTNLNWIFREDIVAEGWNVAIKTPLPATNREKTKECFELGKERNLGIAILALFTLNGDPCCFLVLPEDDTDAQYRLMGNRYVKLSFGVEMRDARAIRNPVLWKIKQLFESKRGKPYWLEDIPSRHTLLPK
jgi:hypothetical protein